ncbi:transcriptional regulator, TetR family [Desulfocurvibacter africanus PCS]|uniref:Transcriptional regulator, TetR family n=1 Tax=Desulfocurvibacter africanus PCS TaxID=1262666 RepID=M5PZ84_DESAF|nr:TetR/AcrR family transcriptional regulator [Desulfocurvibacter africanus]EMG35636.1 transcriptional regulator, TetR family [Desulfocurvibacter africanus PCS]
MTTHPKPLCPSAAERADSDEPSIVAEMIDGREPSKTFGNLEPAKRERVIEAAVEEFSERGFEAASVNRMVARLGIAKGSIFKYFGSKQALFRFAFGHAAAEFAASLRQVRDDSGDLDFCERIRASLLAGVRFIDAHSRLYRLYLRVVFQDDFPLRGTLLAEARAQSGKYLRRLVADGLERGELRPGLDPDWAVFFLDAAMDRFLQAYAVEHMDAACGLHRADPETLARRLDQLVDVLRHGLCAGGMERS